ncbi:SIR2 family protein [Methylorubrum rhodesianum]|uniref:SIR2 family protein n=1 Tax=Methylorubrum rhodesianum TaxID=29427 RepID=A0ABU9Z5Y8_9HYPH
MASFNADLLDDLARQRVVLFLGAGVSSSATTRAGGRIKGWERFLIDACDAVEQGLSTQVRQLIEAKDFLLASELLQQALGEVWERMIIEEFGQMADPSELHDATISLDQRIILTTNFDKLIEVSWEAKLGNDTHLPRVVSSLDAGHFSILKDHRGKYLVKIHGTVDNPNNIVFSRSDYIRLAFGNPTYTAFLEVLLLSYTFVFIGFSMDDPAIVSLMEMYALRYPKSRPHYILSPKGRPDNILEINRRLRKLLAIQYEPDASHSHLPPLLRDLAEQMRQKRREIFAAGLSSMAEKSEMSSGEVVEQPDASLPNGGNIEE